MRNLDLTAYSMNQIGPQMSQGIARCDLPTPSSGDARGEANMGLCGDNMGIKSFSSAFGGASVDTGARRLKADRSLKARPSISGAEVARRGAWTGRLGSQVECSLFPDRLIRISPEAGARPTPTSCLPDFTRVQKASSTFRTYRQRKNEHTFRNHKGAFSIHGIALHGPLSERGSDIARSLSGFARIIK